MNNVWEALLKDFSSEATLIMLGSIFKIGIFIVKIKNDLSLDKSTANALMYSMVIFNSFFFFKQYNLTLSENNLNIIKMVQSSGNPLYIKKYPVIELFVHNSSSLPLLWLHSGHSLRPHLLQVCIAGCVLLLTQWYRSICNKQRYLFKKKYPFNFQLNIF